MESGGSEFWNAVTIAPPRAKESDRHIDYRWSLLSIMDVVEDITLGIEQVGKLSKLCTDTLAVIFINFTSLRTFLLVWGLAGTA